MYQARTPDPTGQNPQGVWVNPMASLAHNFPILVRKAIEIATQRIEAGQQTEEVEGLHMTSLGNYAQALAKFVKITAGEPLVETPKEAKEKSGLTALEYTAAEDIFNNALADVMYQAYFQLLREALHPGEKAIGIKELLDIVPERHIETIP